ncbi:MAG TPA: DUF4143 domain-containing protein [Vicinamibacteria bacterium]|nr:DUF4143 domain-containing protein [Vicinamibacteria bacterium]
MWAGRSSILQITGQIVLVPPFFENFGKRLIKSPKLYFVDSGLVCHLLGLESEAALARSPRPPRPCARRWRGLLCG